MTATQAGTAQTERPHVREARALTPELADRIVQAIQNGATREAAAAAGPIGRTTLYAWLKTGRLHPDTPEGELVARIDDADAHAELVAIVQWRSFFASDWRACAEFLARHPATRERWKRQVEITGPDGAGVTITVEERAQAVSEVFKAYLEGEAAGRAAAEAEANAPVASIDVHTETAKTQ